ncbi:hypothetical protein R6Q59_003826 [Mikania micrantha]
MSAGENDGSNDRIAAIKSTLHVVPDFPKPGIRFLDITTLLLDPKAFKDTIDLFVERYKQKNISVVAGIEARGFMFGPAIALAIGAKFVPLRKPRKLPGEVISEKYVLEYGTDCLEMHVGAVDPEERALVVDDLVATGGTLCAAINLLGISLQLSNNNIYIYRCTFSHLIKRPNYLILMKSNRLVELFPRTRWCCGCRMCMCD